MRQELDQESAGTIAVGAVGELLGHREADLSRDLFGLAEILMGRLFQALAFQGHNTLVAAEIVALVDGHGEVALPDQIGILERGAPQSFDPRGVESCRGAQAVGRLEIHHDHLHRTIGLGLELEPALELQGRAQQHGERRRLTQQTRHRVGIAVAAQDSVDAGAEPDHAAAHVQRFHRERQGDVVGAVDDRGEISFPEVMASPCLLSIRSADRTHWPDSRSRPHPEAP